MKSQYINCKNCKDDCRCRGKNITPICVSFKPVKTTNADQIRGMDDVGLAAWYCHDRDCRGCEFGASDGCHILDWLKAPVEEVKK